MMPTSGRRVLVAALLVFATSPAHCAFEGEVREQAFDDLVAWIERGVQPAGGG
jgi:hypothetical protein